MPRISALPSLTTADNADELPIVDVSASVTKKITRGDLLKAPLPTNSVTTAAIANTSVTASKIDFSTFIHIEASGTFNSGTITAGNSQSITVTIPTQTDNNYRVQITAGTTGGANWTQLAVRTQTKNTGSFVAQVWNNASASAGATSWDYIITRNG